MAIALGTVNLATASVGTNGTIDLSSCGNTAEPSRWNKPATLLLYNDSGCGLNLVFQPSGTSAFLPAGGWRSYPLAPGDSQVQYSVIYLIAGAPVSLLMPEYYAPGEPSANLGILGNSPIGVSGIVNTAGGGGVTTVQESVKSGVSTTGSVLGFTHGLSATPDFIAVIDSDNKHKASSVTNYSNTTCDIYFLGGAITVNFLLYAIKIN